MWDNHEFSWLGWQSFQLFGGERAARADAQGRGQPGVVRVPAGARAQGRRRLARALRGAGGEGRADRALRRRTASARSRTTWRAIESLRRYRSLRFGRHLELILTDHYTHRSQEPTSRREADGLSIPEFPSCTPRRRCELLDAGRAAAGGQPPPTIRFGDARRCRTSGRTSRRRRCSGPTQKAWFLERLRASTATWKVWGNSLGTLDWRADPQNLPAGPDEARGRARATPASAAAATGRRATASARRSTTRCARPASPASSPSRATATASGPACRRRRCRPRPSSRSASRSSRARSPRPASSRPTSTASRRTIRCARSTWPTASGRQQPAINLLLRHGVRVAASSTSGPAT